MIKPDYEQTLRQAVQAAPPIVRDALLALRHAGIPLAQTVPDALAAVSLCAQGAASVQRGSFRLQNPGLWFIRVNAGIPEVTRQAWSQPFFQPLETFAATLHMDHQQALVHHQTACQTRQATVQGLKQKYARAVRDGGPTGELVRQLEELNGQPLIKPTEPALFFSSIRGVARGLLQPGRSVGVWQAPASDLLDGRGKSDGHGAAWFDVWHGVAGKSLGEDTKNMMYLHGNEEALLRYHSRHCTPDDSALLGLFLVWPPYEPFTFNQPQVLPEAVLRLQAVLLALLHRTVARPGQPAPAHATLVMDAQARHTLDAFADQVGEQARLGGCYANIRAYAHLVPEKALRMATQFQRLTDPESAFVSGAAMTAAILFCQIALETFAQLFGPVPRLDSETMLNILRQVYRDSAFPAITLSELRARCPEALKAKARFTATLNLLSQCGWLRIHEAGQASWIELNSNQFRGTWSGAMSGCY